MAVEYTLKKGGTFVYARATGQLTSEEIHEFLLKLGADPGLQSEHVTLFDATELESAVLEDPDFKKTLEIERDNTEKLVARKMAIVVSKASLLGIAHRYKFLAPTVGEAVHVFNTIQDAEDWMSF